MQVAITTHAEIQGRQYPPCRFGIFDTIRQQQAQAIRRVPSRPETRADADLDDPAFMRFGRCSRFLQETLTGGAWASAWARKGAMAAVAREKPVQQS